MQHVRKKERKKERQPANYTHRKYNATYFVTRYQAQYIVETLFAIRHSPFSISPFSTPPFPTLLITVHRIVIPLFPALPSSSSHMVLRDPASSHLISSHLSISKPRVPPRCDEACRPLSPVRSCPHNSSQVTVVHIGTGERAGKQVGEQASRQAGKHPHSHALMHR